METVRALSYSIPVELQDHLDLVHPTVTFPDSRVQPPVLQVPVSDASIAQNSSGPAIPSSCSNSITPACLQVIYHIPTEPATQPESNRLAVTGFLEQFANEANLQTFLSKYRPDMPSDTTFTLQTLAGGSNSQDPNQAGDEANLDIQYTVGVATSVPTAFISVNESTIDGFIDVAHFLLSQNNPPNVLTTSYGFNEDEISPNVARNLCNAYAQLGARGVSVLFSSGDGGVSGTTFVGPNNTCTSFVPTFPSSCPFVTSVGSSRGIPEVAANFSSGGFSNIFSTPTYQTPAIYRYLSALGSTYEGRFNPSGRAYPDIAVQGYAYEIIVGGKRVPVLGTSASTPVFASIVSLLNDRLIAQGQTPLGFLNPFLYTVGAAALNDVTDGSNPGCSTTGFPAGEGWDPVTGLGTPDFERLAFTIGL